MVPNTLPAMRRDGNWEMRKDGAMFCRVYM